MVGGAAVVIHPGADRDRRIDAYDQRRNARFAVPESEWREVDRFRQLALYGWSEDKARQYSVPERQDFGAFVRRQGFKLD